MSEWGPRVVRTTGRDAPTYFELPDGTYECMLCSCIVLTPAVHDTWHDECEEGRR